ncbi:MAG: hypothetical protein Q4E88_00715 [Coriobacteriia bacterium]|nr:hypothetical protein [Coriobacteriia bacterium]
MFKAVPSKETLDNLPTYINKSIELLDNNVKQDEKATNDNVPTSFMGIFKADEIHTIYAGLKKNGNLYELSLTAEKPEEGIFDAVFPINDTDEGVPLYCKDYSTKISNVIIDKSIENFHPVSTMQWFGSYVRDSSEFPYSSLSSITGLRYLKTDKVKNSAFMFSGTKYLQSLSDEDFYYIKFDENYFKSLENATGMFIDSGLDENTLDMFMTKLSNSDILKDCQYTFALCSKLSKFESKNIMLPKVENASSMFSRSALESFNNNIIFGNSVYAITSIFYKCHNLKYVDASSMLENGTSYYIEKDGSSITDEVTSAVSTFQYCENLTYVDLGKWDVSNKQNAAHINYTNNMFNGCSKLTTICARYDAKWETISKNSINMFLGCNALVGQNRTTYSTNNIHIGYACIDEGKNKPGYFTLSEKSSKPSTPIYSLESPIENGIFYYPVCDENHKLPADLIFYNSNKDIIYPKNGSYYLMSDLLDAVYFSGTSSFISFRNYDNVEWADVYSHETSEPTQEFLNKLAIDEKLLSFTMTKERPALSNGVSIDSIWEAYQSELHDKHDYWSKQKDSDIGGNYFAYNAKTHIYFSEYGKNPLSVLIEKLFDVRHMVPVGEVSNEITTVSFDYDDNVVQKVTSINGQITYPKNTKFFVHGDAYKQFKVVMKDSSFVPKVDDGVKKLMSDNDIYTVDERSGAHNIYISRQTKFNVNFECDQDNIEITDKDGNKQDNPIATLNEDFVFKVKYNHDYSHVIKEVRFNKKIIEPDENNCYSISNIDNNINVQIFSQESESLTLSKENSTYFYYPVFTKLSANTIKFYDDEGKYIQPHIINGDEYVMADLKNAQSFIGRDYKFQAIRLENGRWSDLFSVENDKATKYNGKLLDGDYCSTLSFDKDNNKPSIDGVFIGDVLKAYNIDVKSFWGSDTFDESSVYVYMLENTLQSGSWIVNDRVMEHHAVIQREFSDYYNIKFEGDEGVKQIVDSNNKDITNGTKILKNEDFEFKVKCVEDHGTENVEQAEISIGGNNYNFTNLSLNNSTLKYTVKNIEHDDTTGCLIKIGTTYVNSLIVDNCLYHPVFDKHYFTSYAYYDKDGQCLSAIQRPGEYENYIMSDVANAEKYKIKNGSPNIIAVRSITESRWDDVFDRENNTNLYVKKLKQGFMNKLNENDNVCYFDYLYHPYVNDVSLIDIYEAYNQYGFGIKDTFHFFINYVSECGYFFNKYDDTRILYNSDVKPYDVIDNGCCMVISREFGNTKPSCTLEFQTDDGIEKITDDDGVDITDYKVSVDKGSNFIFHVQYKDGYVENSVKDGSISLAYNKDNNSYVINNVQNQHFVNVSSQKSYSLVLPEGTKHPGMIYKPIFDKLSVNEVRFYDKNGHFIRPSQDSETNYVINDLADVKDFIATGHFSFKVVGILKHTWDEAFGNTTTGTAKEYIADDREEFDECATLHINPEEEPMVDNHKLIDLNNLYFNNELYYWSNYAPDNKATMCVTYKDKIEWGTISRDYNTNIVLTRNFVNNPNIEFKKDEGVLKIIDDKGQEISENTSVPFSSNLRFKIIYKNGFVHKNVTANGINITADNDGFFNIKNIVSHVSINVNSQQPLLKSLYFKGDWYHPISDKLSFKDIQFFDANGNLLEAHGDPVQGNEEYHYYLLEDLKTATQYVCDNAYSFQGARCIGNKLWNEIFEYKDDEKKYIQFVFDVKEGLLHDGDSVFCLFKDKVIYTEPSIDGVPISKLRNAYSNDSTFLKSGYFFGNAYYFAEFMSNGLYYASFWSYAKNELFFTYFNYNPGDILITRNFSELQTIKFDKSEGIESFTDVEGREFPSSVQNYRSKDFKFKVKCKEGHVVDKVTINDAVIHEDKITHIFTVNSSLLDNTITATTKTSELLKYDQYDYFPIFDKASTDDIQFYNKDGNLLYPKGDGNTYSMADIKTATQYIIEGDYRFKAVRTVKNSWYDAFAFKEGKTIYNQPMLPGDSCSSLTFHYDSETPKDLLIIDADNKNVDVKKIKEAYFDQTTSFWTADEVLEDTAWEYSLNDNVWSFNTNIKSTLNDIVIERMFGHGSSNINFSLDANIEKVTDIYGTELKSSFVYPTVSDFKFKVVAKDGYCVKFLYVNDEKFNPIDNVYIITHPKGNISIKIEAIKCSSLIVGQERYYPIFNNAPANKISFYDNDNNYIRPTGNNGYSYVMNDLFYATKFAYLDNSFSFESVCLKENSWIEAFGEKDAGVATRYVPTINLDETCTALKFLQYSKPYLHDVPIDDITSAYFRDKKTFWTPYSMNSARASLYDIEYGWIENADKSIKNSILIQKTFSTDNQIYIYFDKDVGIKQIVDDNDKEIPNNIILVPGQEIKFKFYLNQSYIKDRYTFNNQELELGKDGYYHILADSCVIKNSNHVKLSTLKLKSLIVKTESLGDCVYKPVFDRISVDQVKFYNSNDEFIEPSEDDGKTYIMEDLEEATQFYGKDYCFDAVCFKNYMWITTFSKFINKGRATDTVLNLEQNQTCTALNFDYGQKPYISGKSLSDISNIYFKSSTKYWSPISVDLNNAYVYDINDGWGNTDSKMNDNGFLFKTTFSSKNTINVDFRRDSGVINIVNHMGSEIPEKVDAIPGQEIRFKVNLNKNSVIKYVKINDKEINLGFDGYYHVLLDSLLENNNIDVEVTTSKLHSLNVNGVIYKPLFDKLSPNDYRFYDDSKNYIAPSGDDYVMSDLKYATQFTLLNKSTYKFNAVGIIEHTWDSAFGEDTQGKASEYIAGDIDPSCKCVTLDLNKEDNLPKVDNIPLLNIKNAFLNISEFWGNESKDDTAYSYRFNSEHPDGYWDNVRSRTSNLPILIKKEFTEQSYVHFSKDDGIEKFVDDSGKELPKIYNVDSDTSLRFKVVYKDKYKHKSLSIYNKPAIPDEYGFYTIASINSSYLVDAKSQMDGSKISLQVGRDKYHPVSNNLSNKDILFYDDNDNLLEATGSEVPGTVGYKYYLMSDLTPATKYLLLNLDFSFTAVRSVNGVSWDTVYDFEEVKKIQIRSDAKQSFKDTLENGDSVFIFNKDAKPVNEPEVDNVKITDIWNTYKDDPNFGKNKRFWSNSCEYNDGGDNYQGILWDINQQKFINSPYRGSSDVLITRTFSNTITLNFEKDNGIEKFTDLDGQTISTINLYSGNDCKFKVVFKNGFVGSHIMCNEEELIPSSEGVYTAKPMFSGFVSAKSAKPSSLTIKHGDKDIEYKPVFEELSFNKIKFYDNNNNLMLPGENGVYHTTDLSSKVSNYVMDDDVTFKAVRTGWLSYKQAFGDAFEASIEQYKAYGDKIYPIYSDEVLSTLNISKEGDLAPKICGISADLIFPVYHEKYSSEYPLILPNKRSNATVDVYKPSSPKGNWTFIDYMDERQDNYYACVVFEREFKNTTNLNKLESDNVQINMLKDNNSHSIDKFIGDDGKELPSSISVAKNSSLRFKVVPVPGHFVRQVKMGNQILRPDKNGYYYVFSIDNNIDIVAKGSR